MKIKQIVLDRFRGIDHLELDLGGKDTDIYGANGTGKTTIANAISWLLCDAPITGEKEFSPKTVDVHNREHTASVTFLMYDNTPITFGKSYHEVWEKQYGKDLVMKGHTSDYFLNGQPTKKSIFQAALQSASKCPLELTRHMLILGYFMKEKSEDRRNILFELVNVSDRDIIDGDPTIAPLKEFLVSPNNDWQSPAEFKERAMARKKELLQELGVVPVRIKELEDGMPDLNQETVEDIEVEIGIYEKNLAKIREKELSLRTSPKGLAEIELKIAELKATRERRMAEVTQVILSANQKRQEIIDVQTRDKQKLDEAIAEQKLEVKRLCADIRDKQARYGVLLDEYKRLAKKKWKGDGRTCPTCGGAVPKEKTMKVAKSYNREINHRLAEINEESKECSKLKVSKIQAEVDELRETIEINKQLSAELERDIAAVNANMQTVPVFDETDEGKQLLKDIAGCENNRDVLKQSAGGYLPKLQERKAEQEQKMRDAYERMAQIKLGNANLVRISDLQTQQRTLSRELEHIEHGLALYREFTMAKAQKITELINGKFKYIQFRLYRERNNGSLQEVCEPLIRNQAGKLVEYRSANTAAQVKACMEIADVLKKHYGVSLPVLMDGAESVTEPLKTDEQLIRFIVSKKDKRVRVEVKDGD